MVTSGHFYAVRVSLEGFEAEYWHSGKDGRPVLWRKFAKAKAVADSYSAPYVGQVISVRLENCAVVMALDNGRVAA